MMRRAQTFRRALAVCAVIAFGLILSFVVNGASTSWRVPHVVTLGKAAGLAPDRTLRVLAFNAAKCDFHEGGLSFANEDAVRDRLERIAAAIERERPDIVCLSEVVHECGPVDVDQVAVLASRCGFAAYATSDNYSFGLPFFRIRSGNAILSRFPLRGLSVEQLAGPRSIWSPTNVRRALWCEIEVDDAWLLVGSLRNDSFDALNNQRQTAEILEFVRERPALLAGDFNADLESNSIARLGRSGRFAASFDRRATFPRGTPYRRIDYVFGPAAWPVQLERVIDCGTSDHLAVATDFRLP